MRAASWIPVDTDAGVWVWQYSFGAGPVSGMLLRLVSGQLMIVSPPRGMTQAGFDQIEHDGTVTAIVAPCGFHHLGIAEWRARFPKARVFAHPLATRRIAKKGDVDTSDFAALADLTPMLPGHIWVATPPGMKMPDTMIRIHTASGPIWYCNDMVFNLRKAPGRFLIAAMFRWTKTVPGFAIGRLPARLMVKDRAAFRDWWVAELEAHPPRAVIPGHGTPILVPDEAAKLAAMVRDAF